MPKEQCLRKDETHKQQLSSAALPSSTKIRNGQMVSSV